MQDAHPFNPGVVRLRIGRSRSLRAALLLAHLGAAAAVLLVDGPWWVATGLATFVAISAAANLARHFGSVRVHELVLRTDGSFVLQSAAGQESAELRYVSLAEPWLTVFGVRSVSGRRHDIVLLRDNVEQEPFRRLRVRLRQSGRSAQAGADGVAGDGVGGGPTTAPRGGAGGPGD